MCIHIFGCYTSGTSPVWGANDRLIGQKAETNSMHTVYGIHNLDQPGPFYITSRTKGHIYAVTASTFNKYHLHTQTTCIGPMSLE
jgi:hypothetical protein